MIPNTTNTAPKIRLRALLRCRETLSLPRTAIGDDPFFCRRFAGLSAKIGYRPQREPKRGLTTNSESGAKAPISVARATLIPRAAPPQSIRNRWDRHAEPLGRPDLPEKRNGHMLIARLSEHRRRNP